MAINWVYKHFSELTTEELYAILRLRSEVFVVEQNCVFLDMDNKDFVCHHVMGWKEKELLGYSRIVPPGIFDRAYRNPPCREEDRNRPGAADSQHSNALQASWQGKYTYRCAILSQG